MKQKVNFFPQESISSSVLKIFGGGTLLLLATSGFVYDIGVQFGLSGPEVPSAAIIFLLTTAALAVLTPPEPEENLSVSAKKES